MEPLGTLEKILIGAIALLVLLWFRPGLKQAFQRSRAASGSDWTGLLFPIGAVILFVILLIMMARS